MKGYRKAKRSDVKWGAVLFTKENNSSLTTNTFRPVKVEKLSHLQVPAKVGEHDVIHRARVDDLNKKILKDWKDQCDLYYVKEGSDEKITEAEKQSMLNWLRDRSDLIKIRPIALRVGQDSLWKSVNKRNFGAGVNPPKLSDEAAVALRDIIEEICRPPVIKEIKQ